MVLVNAIPLQAIAPDHKAKVTWLPSLFVLNMICELVKRDIRFDRVFRECHLTRVSNDVIEFVGITVTTSQIYKHMRKWIMKWVKVCKLKDLEGTTWSNETTTIMMEEDKLISHLMVR